MKNIRNLIFLAFCTLSTLSSFCQENHLPGYVIDLKGDTITGTIDYRNWAKNPQDIYFVNSTYDQTNIYTPIDISGFSVREEIYVSAIVDIEVSPRKTNELNSNSELEIQSDTAFLQTIIQGEKSLYYNNSSGNKNLYIKNSTGFELLVYKNYLAENAVKENKKFIGQLSLYLYDCPSIQSKLKQLKYSKESLENLFLFYYDCTQARIEFHKKTEKVSTETGVLAVMSLTSLGFSSESFDYLVKAGYAQSINFTMGLFFDIILPRNQRKWSIYNELIFTSYTVKGSYNDFVNEERYTITYTELGYSYLKMNNMVRLKYPVGGFFIYLNAGISNGFAISETNYRRDEIKLYSIENIEEGKALNETRKYEQGYILGLGTKIKKYSFEIRYEKGNGMSEYVTLSSPTKRYYFLLGFRL